MHRQSIERHLFPDGEVWRASRQEG